MIRFILSPRFDKPAILVFLTKDQVAAQSYGVGFKSDLKEILTRLIKDRIFTAQCDEIFPLSYDNRLFLFCGLGESKELTLTQLRIITRKAIFSPLLRKVNELEIIPHHTDVPSLIGVIEGIMLGGYAWTKYRTAKETLFPQDRHFTIVAPKSPKLTQAVTICEGVNLTRDLVNDNSSVVTSEHFEKIIKELVKGHKTAAVTVLNRKELKTYGLNLHLAVNQASLNEPKLIIVEYQGAKTHQPFTAVIGKGITFDTGGLNLKPSGSIETMRFDMAGAGAVVGVLKNILKLAPQKNILFVCAMAENTVDAAAYKPGDVLTSYSGKTVEIGNTDAEGRLVLADAITYLIKNYKPARLIDVATLTGACIVALGYDYTGLISNHEELAQQILSAAQVTDDRVWRMPNYPEIKDYVKSQIADIRNIGLHKGAAGCLTAGEFLRQFTQDIPWAHLDIAGTAFVEDKERMYFGHGATGAGVRLLTELLR
jgi:leucyl aminopeptidase